MMYRGALGSMGLEWETLFLTKRHVAAIRKHSQIATVVGGIQDLLHYLDIVTFSHFLPTFFHYHMK